MTDRPDYSAIIESCRSYSVQGGYKAGEPLTELVCTLHEAANAIEALQAANADLQAERDYWQKRCELLDGQQDWRTAPGGHGAPLLK